MNTLSFSKKPVCDWFKETSHSPRVHATRPFWSVVSHIPKPKDHTSTKSFTCLPRTSNYRNNTTSRVLSRLLRFRSLRFNNVNQIQKPKPINLFHTFQAPSKPPLNKYPFKTQTYHIKLKLLIELIETKKETKIKITKQPHNIVVFKSR